MQFPDCPICKTNTHVTKIPDCSTHAEGLNSKYYSDQFECLKCKGNFSYEEQLVNEHFTMKIVYKNANFDKAFEEVW